MADLSEQDLAAIQDVHDRWINAELHGNHDQVIELCTDDVNWIPPNAPPLNGKHAISAYLDNNRVILQDIQLQNIEIHGNDSVAYLMSSYHTSFSVPDDAHELPSGSDVKQPSSPLQQVNGTHLWILRKTKDGLWRVAVVTWSSW